MARDHHILRYGTQPATSIIINHLAIEYHSAGFQPFFLTSASCRRHSRTVATPLRLWCAQPQVWAYFRMLVFTFGIYGNVRTISPAPSPGNNPRQPVPLIVNAVAPSFWVESAMIDFLSRATAATTTTTSTATAWPADNHYGANPWTLRADEPIQHYKRQAIKMRDEGPASTLKELAPPTPPPPNNSLPPVQPHTCDIACPSLIPLFSRWS